MHVDRTQWYNRVIVTRNFDHRKNHVWSPSKRKKNVRFKNGPMQTDVSLSPATVNWTYGINYCCPPMCARIKNGIKTISSRNRSQFIIIIKIKIIENREYCTHRKRVIRPYYIQQQHLSGEITLHSTAVARWRTKAKTRNENINIHILITILITRAVII